MDISNTMQFNDVLDNTQVRFGGERMWTSKALGIAIENAVRIAFKDKAKTSVTLALEFKAGADGQMDITAAVTTKEPKPEPLPMVAFVDNKGRLMIEDPAQIKLGIEPARLKA